MLNILVFTYSTLAFDMHVDTIAKKANSTRAFLARNIPRCWRKVKQMAHTACIRPIVEYALPVWDPHTKRNTSIIEMVQNRFARNATGNFDRTCSVTSLLNCLNWPTLGERRHQYRLSVMYRIFHNQIDIHWQSKTSSCTRGHSCRLFVPRPWNTMECSQPAAWTTNRSLLVASRVRHFQEDLPIPARPYPELRTWMVV